MMIACFFTVPHPLRPTSELHLPHIYCYIAWSERLWGKPGNKRPLIWTRRSATGLSVQECSMTFSALTLCPVMSTECSVLPVLLYVCHHRHIHHVYKTYPSPCNHDAKGLAFTAQLSIYSALSTGNPGLVTLPLSTQSPVTAGTPSVSATWRLPRK